MRTSGTHPCLEARARTETGAAKKKESPPPLRSASCRAGLGADRPAQGVGPTRAAEPAAKPPLEHRRQKAPLPKGTKQWTVHFRVLCGGATGGQGGGGAESSPSRTAASARAGRSLPWSRRMACQSCALRAAARSAGRAAWISCPWSNIAGTGQRRRADEALWQGGTTMRHLGQPNPPCSKHCTSWSSRWSERCAGKMPAAPGQTERPTRTHSCVFPARMPQRLQIAVQGALRPL